ncbi:MAG: isocitrate lyase/phosphoenolpyruvate mutase family protein [Gemmatimonadetes bacterium]|nr:isocitrate lyase/phosphoenolpyruvate mutase family protein [Gemmatimonadota bacterium]
MSSPGAALRARVAEGLVVCPGVTNPLYARMAERVGFRAVYVTGAGVANVGFGVPDIGLISMSEMLEVSRRIAGSVAVPVIADIDTGHGGVLNVMRTVAEFEAAGVAAVQLEDQVNPKRCGHFANKSVVSVQEMVERVIAATEARRDPGLMIIARTDARAVEGLASGIRRGQTYVEAGADAVFVEAPQSLEELRAIPREFDVPTIANMVEGGRTPLVAAEELAEMGFAIALYANAVARTAAAAARRALETIYRTGSSTALQDEMLTWEERQELVGLPEFQAREDGIVERASSR